MNPQLVSIIESLIFISLEPLNLDKLKSVLPDFPESDVEQTVNELLDRYSGSEYGIHIVPSAGGYIFATKSEADPWIKSLLNLDRKSRLSPAALETLSIIAYHQPVTLAEISSLRGVDATHSLKTLLVKRLVKITGRKNSPGKPLIYRTSNKFLSYFGLNSIQDLPTKEEIEKIVSEDKAGE